MGIQLLWCTGAARAVAVTAFAAGLFGAAGTCAADTPARKQPGVVSPPPAAESVQAERALLKNPGDRSARLRAARARLAEDADKRSNVEEAQQHVLEVLRSNPNDTEALMLAGQTSLLKGDAASAVRYYQSAVASDPTNASAQLSLGDALTRTGNEAAATAAFARYRALMGMPALKTDAGGR
ncbi:MAG TPA: tetratricopeptide repeat protein [Povalibacter sp.]|nr:tetratricopeptide repeat protein [Povalibacter sp.]